MNKKTKVLVIHTKYQNTGGEDIAVLNEIKFLKKHFEVETLYFSNKFSLNPVSFLKQILYLIFNFNIDSKREIESKVKKFKPDIIYVHNTWFSSSLVVFKIAQKNKIKTIVKLHNFRQYCTKYFFSWNHLKGDDFCKACGFKKRNLQIFNKYFPTSLMKSLFVIIYGKAYFKILLKNELTIFTLSDFHKNFLIQQGLNPDSLFVLPNFIKNDFQETSLNNELINEDYLIYAGRVSPEKGIEELINAFKEIDLKTTKLYIVGEGPSLNYLKKKYRNEKIIFLGYQNHDKVLSLIANSLAVVTSTRLFEGQPTILCEASFAGVPSIFPSFGGMPEFFRDDYELSFEQFNYDDLKDKLLKTQNQKLLKNLGDIVNKDINNILSEKTLLDKFSAAFNNE